MTKKQSAKDGNLDGNLWTAMPQAMVAESFANLRRAVRLPHLWEKARHVRKGATPSETVYEDDHLRLYHYPGAGPVKYKTPLLFVFALVNRPYILDILPNKSVVAHFVRAGFDTYLIDWGTPTRADRYLSLDDYVSGYLRRVVRFLEKRTGSPAASILGYCMGGTMSSMFAALYPDRVKNLLLLAAGIDFSTREGLLNVWADPKNFDVDAFIDAYGDCPAEFLQGGFLMLSPVKNLLAKPMSLMEKLDDERFVDEFLTMETWLNDNIPVPGGVFREFVKNLYQQNLLVQNRLPLGGSIVDLKRITCPVLNILATQDNLVPAAQSEPFCDLVGSTDRETIRQATGHIGLAIGSAAQRELWPKAVEWLAQRS
jgi:polyhydroxyalkanoate synthase subunit PhaC